MKVCYFCNEPRTILLRIFWAPLNQDALCCRGCLAERDEEVAR